MNPVALLVFFVIAVTISVISWRSLIQHRREEKKRQQQRQCIKDKDEDRKGVV